MRVCDVEGCGVKHYGKGFCMKHYYRFSRNGSPEIVRTVRNTATNLERLSHHGWSVQENGCWVWLGTLGAGGYGVLRDQDHTPTKAHRLAYRMWVGSIPEGAEVRHKCDNRPCINPEHLEVGTHQDNMNDMVTRGRYIKGRTVRGEEHHDAVLSAEDVVNIRREYAQGRLTQRALAERYGVQQRQVSRIVHGLAWSHVGGPVTDRDLRKRTP